MRILLSLFVILYSVGSFSQRISDSLSYSKIVEYSKSKCCFHSYEKDGATIIYEIRENDNGKKLDEDGQPIRRGDYYKFDASKSIEIYGNYEKGKEEGLFIFFDSLGKVKATVHFSKGKREGPTKNYYSNGTMRLSTDYHKGLKDGEMLGFYSDGTRLFTGKYKKDKMIGQRMYYNVKGEPANGEMTWRYESGAIKLTGKCVNGMPEGRFTHYEENGNIELQVDYLKGIPHGKYIKYSNGHVEYTDCYYLGKKQKTCR